MDLKWYESMLTSLNLIDSLKPANYRFRKCLKFDKNENRKFCKLQNCNFDHPLKDQKVVVRSCCTNYLYID